MRGYIALVSSALLISAACAAPAATPVSTASASPPATATASPTPTVAPTPTQAPTPTVASPTPTASPSPAPTGTPTSNSPVDLLISYAHPSLQSTCHERSQLYDTEVASVTCGDADLPFDYSLFANVTDMAAAYNDDVAGAETPPDPAGACTDGNFEGIYGFEDGRSGHYNCREHTGSGATYHVFEWTENNTLVIGYISNRTDLHTWDDLYNFFVDRGGPYAYD